LLWEESRGGYLVGKHIHVEILALPLLGTGASVVRELCQNHSWATLSFQKCQNLLKNNQFTCDINFIGFNMPGTIDFI
jgi:hypothetical protein